jgi:hypothetical protein
VFKEEVGDEVANGLPVLGEVVERESSGIVIIDGWVGGGKELSISW